MTHRLLCFLFIIGIAPLLMAEEESAYNRVHLSATSSLEIENDLLVAELYSQHEAHSAAEAANQVNQDIEWAVDTAGNLDGIKVRTLEYQTHPVYDKSRIRAWRANQAIRLETTDAEKLGDLIGVLQERVAMRSLGYQVSTATREASEDHLVDEAIAAFRKRAGSVTAAFGFKAYQLVNITINTGQSQPPPSPVFRHAMEMKMDAAPATVEAGTSTLSVSVSGRIEMQ